MVKYKTIPRSVSLYVKYIYLNLYWLKYLKEHGIISVQQRTEVLSHVCGEVSAGLGIYRDSLKRE